MNAIFWTNGTSSEIAARLARNGSSSVAVRTGEHAGHFGQIGGAGKTIGSYTAIDRMIATVAPLNLADPVLISPPSSPGAPWTAHSNAANRPLRVDLDLDPATGSILKRVDFNQHHWVDQVVGIGVAAHEGQLFGLLNQFLNLFMATGLVLISISAVVMWWRRRPEKVLGAPLLLPKRSPLPAGLMILIVAFGAYLPSMGLSLIVVMVTERLVLRRIPAARNWLGLSAAARP